MSPEYDSFSPLRSKFTWSTSRPEALVANCVTLAFVSSVTLGCSRARDRRRRFARLTSPAPDGMSVAGGAPDTAALAWVAFIQHDAERCVERTEAQALKIVVQVLDARLVADGRISVGTARRRLGGIFATLPMHLIETLCPEIVGLQFVVGDRPGRRNAACVAFSPKSCCRNRNSAAP